jgi:hypothetical protein
MEDLYATLGVSSNASDSEIRAAYLALIRQVHPDVEGGDEERAKRITAAYTVLSDPKTRTEYDQREAAALCPVCGRDLRRMGDVESHLYTHYAQEMADACEVCGRKPTQTYNFKSNSGFILARQVWGFSGRLCGVCSQGMFREFQARNITRGPWGIVSFFATIWYLITNSTGYYSKSKLHPSPADPIIDASLRGRSIFARPTVLVSLAIVGFIGFAVFGGLAESSNSTGFSQTVNNPTQNSPTATSPSATQPATPVQQLDWVVGTCVTFSGDLVTLVPCSNFNVDGQITNITTDAAACPVSAEWYVEVTVSRIACIAEN